MRIIYLNGNQQETMKVFSSLKEARKVCKENRQYFDPVVARAYDGYHRDIYIGYVVSEFRDTCPVK